VPYFRGARLEMLLKTKKFDEAKKGAEALIAKGLKQEDPLVLRTVSLALRSPAAKDQKELLTLSVRAAEAGGKIARDTGALALLNAVESHFAGGDKAKAQEYGKKALSAAENDSPQLKQYIEKQVKKYDE